MAEKELIGDTERAFLALLRAGLRRGRAELPAQADWPGIFRLAGQHHVLFIILEAAWQSGAPEEVLGPIRALSVRFMMLQTRRTAVFLSLYRALAAQGLFPLVLKGLVCRNLYPDPDNRPSGDEDLYIEPALFPAVHEALLRRGLRCESDNPSAGQGEIAYTGSDLRIELHMNLFPSNTAKCGYLNELFTGAFERAVTLEIEGVPIRTLSPTDHLLYLICHAFKHFLGKGIGVRLQPTSGSLPSTTDRRSTGIMSGAAVNRQALPASRLPCL